MSVQDDNALDHAVTIPLQSLSSATSDPPDDDHDVPAKSDDLITSDDGSNVRTQHRTGLHLDPSSIAEAPSAESIGETRSLSVGLSIGSNMVIYEDDDDNILSVQRVALFEDAFPSKLDFARSIQSQISMMRSNSLHPQRSPMSIMSIQKSLSHGDTDRMIRRPSALPEAAQSGKLQWRNINIFVGDKSDGNQILHNFTGEIVSGQLLAVMGGSGAGKSTFLDALSGRSNLNQLTVEGELAINGYKFKITKQELIRSLCTFVPQSDVLCPTQTVEEALIFYANLKLASKSEEVRMKRVNYLIEVLHLTECRDTVIGDERKRGISGGEKRRCSIAAELLNDADIIFLDEPTSGLDAYTAARTIKTLKQFCLISNKMVIATIHQPAVEVFYLFDQLILLGAGRQCFHSAINNVDEYFADKISPTQNPADVVIYEAALEPDHYADRWANDHDLNPFAHPAARRENDSKWDSLNKIDLKLIENGQIGITLNEDGASWYLQFWILSQREVISMYRDHRLFMIRLFQIIFLAAFNGLLFINISQRPGIKLNFIFMSSLSAVMYSLVTTISVFPAKKLLFQRESRSGNYVVSSWALSSQIMEIPREIVFMALFTLIAVKLSSVDGLLWQYILVFYAANFAGGSVGILCGALSRDLKEAALISPVPFVMMLFLSDHLVSLSNFPAFIRPLAQINPLYLLAKLLIVVEWFNLTSYIDLKQPPGVAMCAQLDLFDQSVMAEDRLRERTKGMNCTEILNEIRFGTTSTMNPTVDPDQTIFCPPNMNMTQSVVYNTFNVDPDDFQRWMIQLGVMAVTVRILAIFVLYFINRNGFSWFQSKIKKCFGFRCRKKPIQEDLVCA